MTNRKSAWSMCTLLTEFQPVKYFICRGSSRCQKGHRGIFLKEGYHWGMQNTDNIPLLMADDEKYVTPIDKIHSKRLEEMDAKKMMWFCFSRASKWRMGLAIRR